MTQRISETPASPSAAFYAGWLSKPRYSDSELAAMQAEMEQL